MARKSERQIVLLRDEAQKLFAKAQEFFIRNNITTGFSIGIGTNGDGGFCVLALQNDSYKVVRGVATFRKAFYINMNCTVGKKVPCSKVSLLAEGNWWKCRIK